MSQLQSITTAPEWSSLATLIDKELSERDARINLLITARDEAVAARDTEIRNLRSTIIEQGSRLTQRTDELAAVKLTNEVLEAENDSLKNEIESLKSEIESLKAEIESLKTAGKPTDPGRPTDPTQPTDPHKPIEVSPDITVTLEGIGSLRPPLSGERQGDEIRYRGSLTPEIDVLIDCKDDGQIAITLERCWSDLPSTAQPIDTTFSAKVGSDEKFRVPARINHHCRPRKIINQSPSPKFDLAALVGDKLTPNYLDAIKPSESELVKIEQGRYPWEKQSPIVPLGQDHGQIINSWVGGAGSLLNEAAHLMPVQIAHLLTGDPRAWNEVVRLANSSGNYAIHYKLPHSGHFPLPSETGSLPFLQSEDAVTLRTATGAKLPVPDVAHQHSLTYIAYLLTGERYYREELEAWCTFNLLTRPKNADRLAGIIFSGQVRSTAWALRTLLQAWHAHRDQLKDIWKFEEQIKNNLAWMNSRFVSPTSPDYRATGVVSLSPFRPTELLSFVTDLPRPPWFATWNHHILASVLNECRRAGFTEAVPILNHVLRVIAGVWQHSQSRYDLPWGNHVQPTGSDNWPAIIGATFRGRGTPPSSFQEAGSKIAGDYLAWARSAIVAAVDMGQSWAPEALAWTDAEAARWRGIPIAWQINPMEEN